MAWLANDIDSEPGGIRLLQLARRITQKERVMPCTCNRRWRREFKMKETRLGRRRPRTFGVLAGISAAVFYGFTTSGKQATTVQPAHPPAVVMMPAVTHVVSVQDLMVGVVGHAADELWGVEQEGRAPKTDEDWLKLEHHAIQLAASGTLTALGGTGRADAAWARRPDWAKYLATDERGGAGRARGGAPQGPRRVDHGERPDRGGL